MSNLFKQLLQDAKELPSLSSKYDSPKLHHNLSQLDKETTLITSKISTDSKDNNALGHYFLAQGGANTHENSQFLEKVDTKFTFQPTQMIKKTNVEAHLTQVQETYIKETIDESSRKTRQTVSNAMIDKRNMHWRSKRNVILEEWDLEENNKTFGYMGTKDDTKATSLLKDQKRVYLMAVTDINNQRIVNSSAPVVKTFANWSQSTTCTHTQRSFMNVSWDIISHLTGEGTDPIAGAYLFNNPDQIRIASMESHLIKSARRYLEHQFRTVVNDTLREHATAANVGGSLSEKHRLNAFMKLKHKKRGSSWSPTFEVYDDMPIWLFTYLLVRCGYYNLALEYVEEKAQNFSGAPEFRKAFKEFCTDPNFNISDQSKTQVDHQYYTMTYSERAPDPYKVLLYKIIGRCELQHKSESIIHELEDALWLHLMLVRETPEALKLHLTEYRHTEFQEMINQENSSRYDKNGTNPWAYFNMLLLSLQFEKAIDYLYQFEHWKVQAVHIAIVFVYYGLVRVTSQPGNIYAIVSNANGTPCLNLIGMITQYIQIALDDCRDALQYLFLLTLYPDQAMYSTIYDMVVEQIVRCPDFKEILGNKAACRVGLIDKYKPLLGFRVHNMGSYEDCIVTPIAEAFQSRGRYKDAVYVFESLGKYEQVFGVLNQEIYRAINRYNTADQKDPLMPAMQDIIDVCASAKTMYDKSPASVYDSSNLITFNVLLKFLKATIENHFGHSQSAVELIKQTDLLPQLPQLSMVQRYVQQLMSQQDYVRNLLPYMILIALNDKSQSKSISYFLTFSKLQMSNNIHLQIDQKLMQFNI
ncbi:NIC-domain-containing protein [Mucor ambiguus]|uniref:Nuclear pore protein n=1 Tax=Mucor ambiguus TaxID=91626 RepID=A0A0C9LSV1_9FUNG|nr:NIC-domain-containing protein [Mucor ambiguus]